MIRLETITTWSIAWTTVKLAALCVLVLRILQCRFGNVLTLVFGLYGSTGVHESCVYSAGSQSTHSHWLIACAVVLGTRWLATCTVVQRQGHGSLHVFQQVKKRTQSACQESASGSVSTASHTCKLRRQHEDRDAWRKLVGSEPVAAAWDKLCNSIIQEVHVISIDSPAQYCCICVSINCHFCHTRQGLFLFLSGGMTVAASEQAEEQYCASCHTKHGLMHCSSSMTLGFPNYHLTGSFLRRCAGCLIIPLVNSAKGHKELTGRHC